MTIMPRTTARTATRHGRAIRDMRPPLLWAEGRASMALRSPADGGKGRRYVPYCGNFEFKGVTWTRRIFIFPTAHRELERCALVRARQDAAATWGGFEDARTGCFMARTKLVVC